MGVGVEYRLDDEINALERVRERHPEITREDAIHAWRFCIKSMPRLGKEPEEWVGIGMDAAGRLLEVVAIRNERGAWLIKHAQTPPQEKIKRELGAGRRKR